MKIGDGSITYTPKRISEVCNTRIEVEISSQSSYTYRSSNFIPKIFIVTNNNSEYWIGILSTWNEGVITLAKHSNIDLTISHTIYTGDFTFTRNNTFNYYINIIGA